MGGGAVFLAGEVLGEGGEVGGAFVRGVREIFWGCCVRGFSCVCSFSWGCCVCAAFLGAVVSTFLGVVVAAAFLGVVVAAAFLAVDVAFLGTGGFEVYFLAPAHNFLVL